MQKVISKLISENQSGYRKTRYIGINARLIMDIIEKCEKSNTAGAILCLDYEKAFDSLNWNFMLASLNKYGFGSNFIKWVKILYNSPTFCIKNNGWISREGIMKRGVRQGCHVSALLFILAIEFMSIDMKSNKEISGIKVKSSECKILQYADDTTLTLGNTMSISNSLKVLHKFSAVSGLKLNIAKCQGLWLGEFKANLTSFEGIQFVTCPIKCLGIYIGTDFKECEKQNWSKKITSIEQMLIKWSSRTLTIYGKATVINCLAIPKLIYIMSLLPVPQYVIDKLKKIIFNICGESHIKLKETL